MKKSGLIKGEKKQQNFSPEFKAHMFKKGVSANPAGRPKSEHSITSCMREIGNMTPLETEAFVRQVRNQYPQFPREPTQAQMLAAKIWLVAQRDASSGHWSNFIECILERLEGKVTQPISGADGGPITAVIRTDMDDKEIEFVHKLLKKLE